MQIKSSIEKWLEENGNKGYADSYNNLVNYLAPKHKNVVTSANYQELLQTGKIIYLNDHGPAHINVVIRRALELISTESCILNCKELFYLISAIQIHDIGNFYGRSGHEQSMRSFLPEIKPILNIDDIELRYIRQIAEAHGGVLPNGDKDKISKLEPIVKTDNVEVKQQLIAAILRFSDELADEKSRCDKDALEKNLLPKTSEIFHAYSYCLDCTLIKHDLKTIELHFKIPKEFAIKKFDKGGEEIYLIDEIYNRILKMHQERVYVSRFWRNQIDLEKIWVRLEFYSSYLDDHVCDKITFEVKETGYPTSSINGLFDLCSELTTNGSKLDGAYVAKKINQSQ